MKKIIFLAVLIMLITTVSAAHAEVRAGGMPELVVDMNIKSCGCPPCCEIPDSDKDGVPDNLDKCPGTPAGAAVDKDGCPLDSDRDGVPDYLDKCPDTPEGMAVDKHGCPPELDSDRDGVPDNLDKCPGTPAGTVVDKDGCLPVLDSDRDGVPDNLDKCPDTPASAAVDKDGCPIDSDKDGVPDYLDKCPQTPVNFDVDKDGCPQIIYIELNVEFDSDKAIVKKKYHKNIKKIADFMIQYPQTKIIIKGHTDKVGDKISNRRLSKARANSIRQYLIDKFGINGSRIKAIGYGFKKPVASNKTKAGRQKNRRVEVFIETVKKK